MKDIEKEFVSLKAEGVIDDIEEILGEVFSHYINTDPDLSLMSEERQYNLIDEMKEFFLVDLERRLKDKGMLKTLSTLESAGF